MMTETSKEKKRRIAGYVMAVAGFLMILANALDYMLGWGIGLMPLFVIGIALVVVGTNLTVRK